MKRDVVASRKKNSQIKYTFITEPKKIKLKKEEREQTSLKIQLPKMWKDLKLTQGRQIKKSKKKKKNQIAANR